MTYTLLRNLLSSALLVEDGAIGDRVPHHGICCNILARVGGQDHAVRLHVLRYAAPTGGIPKLSRWIFRERRENPLGVHAGLRHATEFQRRVVAADIADIRSKQNAAA